MTIKELRTLSGMTQMQFSAYLHIPLETIKGWESEGKRKRSCNEYIVELIEYKLKHEEIMKAEDNNADGREKYVN